MVSKSHQAKLEFKSFNHSLDRCFQLVRAGSSNLYLIDNLNFKLEEKISGFWLYEGNPTKPIGAAASLDADTIVGISQLEEKKYVFHYYNSNLTFENKTKTQLVTAIIPERSLR